MKEEKKESYACEDEPVLVWYYPNGQKKYEVWGKDWLCHREDGPARIEYYENGQIKEEIWFKDGKVHKEDGPAHIWYDEKGCITKEGYYFNGEKTTKQDLPYIKQQDYIKYCENRQKEFKTWYKDGELHKEDRPDVKEQMDKIKKVFDQRNQKKKIRL
jgi:hypothetical protein